MGSTRQTASSADSHTGEPGRARGAASGCVAAGAGRARAAVLTRVPTTVTAAGPSAATRAMKAGGSGKVVAATAKPTNPTSTIQSPSLRLLRIVLLRRRDACLLA